MQTIKQIYGCCFSPCGTTKMFLQTITKELSNQLTAPYHILDFTLPSARNRFLSPEFTNETLLIFGTPTYAGRVPNKFLPFLTNAFSAASGTNAFAFVTYGGRSFDDALLELCTILHTAGFAIRGGAAFASSHSFSDRISEGKPGKADIALAVKFARNISLLLADAPAAGTDRQDAFSGFIPGDLSRGYYVPLSLDGTPARFLKAAPKTDPDLCDHCHICALACPMGVIDASTDLYHTGACIKCMACVKKCPRHAKYFDDPAFLSHITMLEDTCREQDSLSSLFFPDSILLP